MTIKYEPVFGNQELFDGAGTFTGLDVVVHSIASGIKSYARLSDLTPESLRNHPVCAMRRIIKEPKRWTVEDKKAGVPPEVGALLVDIETGDQFSFVGVIAGSKRWACKDACDGLLYFFESHEMSPIETPEEKAARLKDEWCSECTSKYYPRGHKGFPEMIYDALLSGELKAPTND